MINKGSNLCSIYMLPLTGLNKSSFGESNFINSYLAEDNVHLVVELKQVTTVILHHSFFRFSFMRDGRNYAAFEIPTQLRDTLPKFREGRYSEFSQEAKTVIIRKLKSDTMPYKKVLANGQFSTAREFLVLEKKEEERLMMEKELAVKIEKNAELASIPGSENFIELHVSKTVPI